VLAITTDFDSHMQVHVPGARATSPEFRTIWGAAGFVWYMYDPAIPFYGVNPR